jgi:hypothetical protein
MQRFSPTELVGRLKSGLLSFPVTPFAEDLSLDVRRFAEHVVDKSLAGVTVCELRVETNRPRVFPKRHAVQPES